MWYYDPKRIEMPRNTQDHPPSPQRRTGSEDPNLESVYRLHQRQANAAMRRLALAEFASSEPRTPRQRHELAETIGAVMTRLQQGNHPRALADARALTAYLKGSDSTDPRVVPSHAPSGNMPSRPVDQRDPGLHDRPTHIMPPVYVSDQRHGSAA